MRNERMTGSRGRAGFTLIEVLVVFAVVVVLIALLVPLLGNMRMRGAIADSSANLRSLAMGTLTLAGDNNGRLPTVTNWRHALYPVLYEGAEWPGFEPWETGENLRGSVFYCPLKDLVDEGQPVRSYGYNAFLDGVGEDSDEIALVNYGRPVNTVFFGTTRNSSSLRSADRSGGTLSDRADGRVLLVYLDGHLEALPPADIPESGGEPFWSGG